MKQVKYPVVTMMAAANEIFSRQGFIRSGQGYTKMTSDDGDPEIVQDNRTALLELVDSGYDFSQQQISKAQEMIDTLSGKMMLKKMTGSLTTFDQNIVKILADLEDTNNFGRSIIASLPHGFNVDRKREAVNDRMGKLKHSSTFMGEKSSRYDMVVEILDSKYIQSSDIYMITCIYAGKDIIKFWWRDQPDLSDIIHGKHIKIRGTVIKHEFSKYSNAKETMLNRVKVVEIC